MAACQALVAEVRGNRLRSTEPQDRALPEQFERCLVELRTLRDAPGTPDRTREKIRTFLDLLTEKHRRQERQLLRPAFLLNAIGEGVARSGLVHARIVETLQVGLYFWGLQQIERRWAHAVPVYSLLHAELLAEYFSRAGLKAVLARAERRLEAGRVFCLTWDYLSHLRRRYWQHVRASNDALERAHTGGSPMPEMAAEGEEPVLDDPGPGRLNVLSRVFSRELTARQQWIYLAKNRDLVADPPDVALGEGAAEPSEVERLLEALVQPDSGFSLGWSEMAERLGINEKSVKREYLKGLRAMLAGVAREIHGPKWVATGLVRRVLEALADVVQQKDLRIKSTTGRGMRALVEKWEVALRLLVNDERVGA